MKAVKYLWGVVALLAFGLVSCEPKNEKEVAVERECSFVLKAPLGVNAGVYSDLKISFKSNKDGQTSELISKEPTFKKVLLEGVYEVSVEATLAYQSEKLGRVSTPISIKEQVTVTKERTTFELTPQYVENSNAGFVIEELFFSPTIDPETGKTFKYSEQYIKITNNSDVTLFADSLAIVQSEDLCNMKREYVDSPLDKALTVSFVSMIPGDGKSHPVKPGASLIIANDAKDHSKVFKGATDLSHADFEIYDLSENPRFQDVDNPEVPNLISYYKSSLTLSSFHQRGVTTIALVRMPVDRETFIKDYLWDGKYIFKFKDFVKEMSLKTYKIPHEWMVDVVFLGIEDAIEWRFIPDVLDAGYTGWCKSFNDKTGQGTAVIRKVAREANGRKYLMDTNNSTNDFNNRVQPSLKATKQ